MTPTFRRGTKSSTPIKKQQLLKDGGNSGPRLDLEDLQISLARRLDTLTRTLHSTWLVRGLDERPTLSRDSLVERCQIQPLVADALEAHVDAIALEAILLPEQADRSLAMIWIGLGPLSLLDPALSSRLKLTPEQRDGVKLAFARKEKFVADRDDATRDILLAITDSPENLALCQLLNQEAHGQNSALDAEAWGVLTKSQMKTLTRILAAGSGGREGQNKTKP